MNELEPPAVPLEGIERSEKKSFFQKLFQKKSPEIKIEHIKPVESESLPALDLKSIKQTPTVKAPTEMPKPISTLEPVLPTLEPLSSSLPELPALQAELPEKTKKPKMVDIKKLFGSSKIPEEVPEPILTPKVSDFAHPAAPQINIMINKAEKHVAEKKEMLNRESIGIELPPLDIETPQLPKDHVTLHNEINADSAEKLLPVMPASFSDKQMTALEKEHHKLRKNIERTIQKKQISSKREFFALLKQYDQHIEARIKAKDQHYAERIAKLNELHKLLKKKEVDVKKLFEYLKKLDATLKFKDKKLNEIIKNEVEEHLNKRSKQLKQQLRNALTETQRLNAQLQKKLDILEDDRINFEKKRDKLLTEEQVKLSSAQELYEMKLSQLDTERKEFEQRKKASMELLQKGDVIAKELIELRNIKEFVKSSKDKMSKQLMADKELKHTITEAEMKLEQEKSNLDNLIFSRYIESKLRGGQSEPEQPVFQLSVASQKIYDMMKDCKLKIIDKNLPEAKRIYNDIKLYYEGLKVDKIEKSILFDAIRTLYNEIKIASVDTQLEA